MRWVSPLGWAILALGVLCWYVGVRFGWVELLVVAAACGVLVARLPRPDHRPRPRRHPQRGRPAAGHRRRPGDRPHRRAQRGPHTDAADARRAAGRRDGGPVRPAAADARATSTRSCSSSRPPPRRHPGRPRDDRPGRPARRHAPHREWTERPSSSSTRAPSPWSRSAPACCATSRAAPPRTLDERPRLPRAARVPAGRRPPLHPLARSAKAGRLLVRQFLDTRRSHVTVLVDPDPARTATPAARTSSTSGPASDIERDVIAANSAPAIQADVETAISSALDHGAGHARRAGHDDRLRLAEVSRSIPQVALDVLARVEPAPVDLTALSLRRGRPRRRHEHPASSSPVRTGRSSSCSGPARSSAPEVTQRHRRRRPGGRPRHPRGGGLDHPHRRRAWRTCARVMAAGVAAMTATPSERRQPFPRRPHHPDPGPLAAVAAGRARGPSSTSSSRRRSSCSPWSASARPTTGMLAGRRRRRCRPRAAGQPSGRQPPLAGRGHPAGARRGLPPARRPDRGARGPDRRGDPHAGGDRRAGVARRSAAGRRC